jgi:hypothetical protein
MADERRIPGLEALRTEARGEISLVWIRGSSQLVVIVQEQH